MGRKSCPSKRTRKVGGRYVTSAIALPLLLSVAAGASVVGGMLLCLRKAWPKESLYDMVSVGGGLLFALTVLDLLPHSMEHGGRGQMLFVLLGFAFLFVIEAVGPKGHGGDAAETVGVSVGFFLHAFLEGLSLVASFRADAALSVPLVSAMILHKLPDGVTVASLLLASSGSRAVALAGAAALGLVTLAGGFSIAVVDQWLGTDWPDVVLAFAAGVFLYVSASHLVPLVQHSGRPRAILFFFAAMVAYFALTVLLGSPHSHA